MYVCITTLHMQNLNLPGIDLRIRNSVEKREVFDVIRKKFVSLTQEEWVRQHFLHYLINQKNVPASLIGVEKQIKFNRLKKRFDIVVFGKRGNPILIVECKAPEVSISQDVFHQIALYNMTLKVSYLLVTNGLEHFACYIDHDKSTYSFLKEIPDYAGLE